MIGAGPRPSRSGLLAEPCPRRTGLIPPQTLRAESPVRAFGILTLADRAVFDGPVRPRSGTFRRRKVPDGDRHRLTTLRALMKSEPS